MDSYAFSIISKNNWIWSRKAIKEDLNSFRQLNILEKGVNILIDSSFKTVTSGKVLFHVTWKRYVKLLVCGVKAYEIILHDMGIEQHTSHLFSNRVTWKMLCQKNWSPWSPFSSHVLKYWQHTREKLQSDIFGDTLKNKIQLIIITRIQKVIWT